MEKYRCKFCSRSFGNGRALGGHIRSHMVNLYAESKHPERRIHGETEPIPSSETDDDGEKDSSFSAAAAAGGGGGGSVVLQDTESETESSPSGRVFRRSKRVKKSRISETSSMVEGEPGSSISETSPEEHVAYCLMMLSKDKWIRDGEENCEVVKKMKGKGKCWYRCEACSKVFRSYQALGGHRASHKKIRAQKTLLEEDDNGGNAGEKKKKKNEKIHECPICFRVFSSGQALGGHKRSHFADSVSAIVVSPEACSASTSTPMKQGLSRTGGPLIDLNLPAPMEDYDYDDDDLLSFPC
ncbi:PREDICTED: zinc finger protein ZAT1 isoform X2 [Ipomoea nil]|uniref:zinc finger protein ZAT1 isoform X2 n=1 Tax=Ipomoea nil TaxID=35883 RepID=UPI0009011C5C|nr:PREDICTED: zinc finger protein ZAT1 isoform X2 [Ipomoea nil]